MICDGKVSLDIRRHWCKDINALIQDGVRIPIVRTPGPLGGMRNWWLCPRCEVSVRHRGLLLPRLPPFGEFKDLELMHVGVWH